MDGGSPIGRYNAVLPLVVYRNTDPWDTSIGDQLSGNYIYYWSSVRVLMELYTVPPVLDYQ